MGGFVLINLITCSYISIIQLTNDGKEIVWYTCSLKLSNHLSKLFIFGLKFAKFIPPKKETREGPDKMSLDLFIIGPL